jgi:hypothetical protein
VIYSPPYEENPARVIRPTGNSWSLPAIETYIYPKAKGVFKANKIMMEFINTPLPDHHV